MRYRLRRPRPFRLSNLHQEKRPRQLSHRARPDSLGRRQQICFYVADIGNFDIILGLPWLLRHDPHIDWQRHLLLFDRCPSTCKTPQGCTPFIKTGWTASPRALLPSSSAPSHDVDLSKVPPQLHDLAPVFSKSSAQQLPPHRPYDITLPLKPDTVPPRGPLYILSPKELKTLHEWLEEQLRLGLIRPSSSPASSPILFVKKKDGSLRLCVDYRGLNFFTKIDLRAAYNLLRVASGEEWKTAFRTHFGLYETLVMPFGLTNAPPVFQAFITDVLRTHIGRYAAVYLEDILIYSNTLDEHWTHVRAVLTDLLSAQLFAKLEKCDFAQPRVEFLGFFIGQGTLEMDPDKLSTIREWPLPTNVKQIQQFLGFCNFYRRFVSRYAHHAGALSALTHKDTPFDIGPSTSAYLSFTSLRNALLSAPLLRSFDPTRPIQLITDASDFALAANLHQPDDDDVQHPVAFFSRQLAPAEKNYTAYDKEMLAIVEGLRQFRHWCHGCASQLTILTDHRNLVYFQQAQRLNDRQARWQEQLAEFHFVIEHLAGAKNPADPPSRRPDYGAASDNNHRLQVLLPPQLLKQPILPQHPSVLKQSSPFKRPRVSYSLNYRNCVLMTPSLQLPWSLKTPASTKTVTTTSSSSASLSLSPSAGQSLLNTTTALPPATEATQSHTILSPAASIGPGRDAPSATTCDVATRAPGTRPLVISLTANFNLSRFPPGHGSS
ncbi:unnamed protein product [Tilletia controversa]|uniref:RNA-directed DNA polymerase n=1 Tax=Tilletia caries TaxID=13290 RepID=A0ABN7IRR0_9BASI|nr:unnamed protein product [Tilletia caries]CAD6962021.1 unnamed protein product [Tilletia controversa]CAD7060664.1 unnamed protein product [Tilletia caries]